jgi:hypothetical protein
VSVKRVCCLMIATLLVAACVRVGAPVVGRYRATIEVRGGELPFHVDVAREGDRYVLYLLNGEERTRVDAVRISEGELVATFPDGTNTLRARMSRKALRGTVTLTVEGGGEQELPMQARLGETHRFYAQSLTDNVDIEGRWEVLFTSQADAHYAAVAVFEQEHDRVTGTVTSRAGEREALEGQVRDADIRLSAFAGNVAHLYKLHMTAGGELEGEYWRGNELHTVHAKRNVNVTIDTEMARHASARHGHR